MVSSSQGVRSKLCYVCVWRHACTYISLLNQVPKYNVYVFQVERSGVIKTMTQQELELQEVYTCIHVLLYLYIYTVQ